jgi:5-methyltetrahydrofolate--homocysteine methyltransferase
MSEETLLQLKTSVVQMQPDVTRSLTRDAMDGGVPALEILNTVLLPALDEVGVLFREGEYFLPDVLMAVRAYNNAYEFLDPVLKKSDYKAKGLVLLGTVDGDIHEIGKNILLAMLQGNGFQVVDLGVQVPPDVFLSKAEELQPDLIGMSSLLTTTMPAMKETIDLFKGRGVRNRFKFLVGGSPVNQSFADEIGADGYGEDAQAGVELARSLMG